MKEKSLGKAIGLQCFAKIQLHVHEMNETIKQTININRVYWLGICLKMVSLSISIMTEKTNMIQLAIYVIDQGMPFGHPLPTRPRFKGYFEVTS